jgi:predicted transcriptional regulator
MPETATLEEIAAEFALHAALKKGEEDADAGRVVSQEEAMRRAAEWLPT